MVNLPQDFRQIPTEAPQDLRQVSIAIALSGGGYRAAAFHLGTLAYLDKVKLLPQLQRLSTVSGGSFTGAKYILSLVEKIPFIEFFQDFYAFLKDVNLFQYGLSDLSQGAVRVPAGHRKLILSMANVYADTFLKAPDGSPYSFGTVLDAEIPVKEVIFNTTEFRTGVAFRFQRSTNRRARIGNGNVYINRESAKAIRLADIVAASSCFPGGFEPLEFPMDFAWPQNQVPDDVQASIRKNGEFISLALMDGGIYDNQGVDSLLLADNRKDAEIPGIFIISDVDSARDDLYPYPQNNQPPSRLNLNSVDWIVRLFLLICLLTVGSIGYEIWQEVSQGTFILSHRFFSTVMPLILVAGVIGLLWWGRNVIKTQLLPRVPQVGVSAWKDLKTLRIDEFLYILELRYTSLLALTSSVFMDRIKALIFDRVYRDEKYKGKRISNRIDRLLNRDTSLPEITPLSPVLRNVAAEATAMATTLWFDHPQQLKNVTAAGQATICFNLMQYIVRRYGENSENYPPSVQELWIEMKQDWDRLNADPYALLKELLPDQ